MILIIDNYDSFTLNLAEYFHRLGQKTHVLRNDLPFEEYLKNTYKGVVLSPGPQLPKDANQLMRLIAHFEDTHPILGICLGHQALNEFYGGTLKKLPSPKHGKLSRITHLNNDLYHHLPTVIEVVRYHSWEIDQLSTSFIATSHSLDDNCIMTIQHYNKKITGVQFHPESILTKDGIEILKNWLTMYGIS